MKHSGFWLAAVVAVIADQLTKRWAVQTLMPGPELQIWPEVFHLTYVENTGAAWSLFEQSGGFLKWISLVVAVALIVFALRVPRMSGWEQAGYGLILAGAVGNGIDRFIQGYVVDFLNFTLINFPVFNIADVAINLGVACLIMSILLQNPQPEHEAAQLPPPVDSGQK
ncbi:MAG: lipoprotein signal peptidase [Synechococcaceae cyanobacterium SM2_3_1]|nr:lipoprotein signal peptidase [Synechococcaceae cyanobacterium SM2_3_1]